MMSPALAADEPQFRGEQVLDPFNRCLCNEVQYRSPV
jgi:hypothetical protein